MNHQGQSSQPLPMAFCCLQSIAGSVPRANAASARAALAVGSQFLWENSEAAPEQAAVQGWLCFPAQPRGAWLSLGCSLDGESLCHWGFPALSVPGCSCPAVTAGTPTQGAGLGSHRASHRGPGGSELTPAVPWSDSSSFSSSPGAGEEKLQTQSLCWLLAGTGVCRANTEGASLPKTSTSTAQHPPLQGAVTQPGVHP